MRLDLMFITNDPCEGREALAAGANRLMVDLECMGKQNRQEGRSTVISGHTLADVSLVRQALPDAEMLVRTNPPNPGLGAEIDAILQRGVDVIMLPFFHAPDEVTHFVEHVHGRARVCLLVETPQALARLPLIASVPGVDEIMVGLNDLHLGLGLQFMFEIVAGGLVDHMATIVHEAGLRFGFGGIARMDEGLVPGRLVLSEHVRLESSLVILSRSFRKDPTGSLHKEISRLREEEGLLRTMPQETLLANRDEFRRRVWEVAECR